MKREKIIMVKGSKTTKENKVLLAMIVVVMALFFISQAGQDELQPVPEVFTFLNEEGDQITRVYGVDGGVVPSRSGELVKGSVSEELSENRRGLFGNLFAFVTDDDFLTGTAVSSGDFVVVRDEFEDYGNVYSLENGRLPSGELGSAGSTCRVGEYINAYEVKKGWWGLGSWQRSSNLFNHLYEVVYSGDDIRFSDTYLKDRSLKYSWECLKQVNPDSTETDIDFTFSYNYVCRDGIVSSSTLFLGGYTPWIPSMGCASGTCEKQFHSSSFQAGTGLYPYSSLLNDMCAAHDYTDVDEGRFANVNTPDSANAKWEEHTVTGEKRTTCLPGYHIRGESEFVTERSGHLYCDAKPADCPPDYTEEKDPRSLFGGEVRWVQHFTHDDRCNKVLTNVEYMTVCDPGFHVTGYDVDTSSAQGEYSCTRIVESDSTEERVEGCMDPEAVNYDPSATVHLDGSCGYEEGVEGCMDPEAINYDSSATVHLDGSCEYEEGDERDFSPPEATDPSDEPSEEDEEFDLIFWGVVGVIAVLLMLLLKDYSKSY